MNKVISLAATVLLAAGMSAVASPAVADCAQPNCGRANGAGGWIYHPSKPVTLASLCANNYDRAWVKQNCKPAGTKFYVVKRGDTLWRIAIRAFGTSRRDAHAGQQYRKLMRLNHLHSTKIMVGQKLRIR